MQSADTLNDVCRDVHNNIPHFMLSQKSFLHACFKRNTKLGERSVQSCKDFTDIVVISIVSHMSDADDFACKYIKRTGKHDVVVIFDTIEDGVAVVPSGIRIP